MMHRILAVVACIGVPASGLRVRDPSDMILPSQWAADNALFADYRGASTAQGPRDATVYHNDLSYLPCH